MMCWSVMGDLALRVAVEPDRNYYLPKWEIVLDAGHSKKYIGKIL